MAAHRGGADGIGGSFGKRRQSAAQKRVAALWSEEGNRARDLNLLASRHQPTAILPPRGTITYPLVQAMQSPPSAICVVEWTTPKAISTRHAPPCALARRCPNLLGPQTYFSTTLWMSVARVSSPESPPSQEGVFGRERLPRFPFTLLA